jgi:signal transduction histidine kinase
MRRTLSGQLMTVQDEERRRLARELHDSIGQYLVALKIKLEANMSRLLLDSRLAKLLADSVVLVDQCLRETRTIAYLLHPPLLDQMGLPSALRWYVDGFAERSGINMSLDIAPGFSRLPTDLETALFRIVQESLTNIHRHSGSITASIRLVSDAESVSLEVKDQGHGIPPDKLQHCADEETVSGMGIASMKERIRQFGGQLTLSTGRHGTTVTATLPVGANE